MSEEERREYLRRQSHEQLEIFILNDEYLESIMQDKLFLLAGCSEFGGADGTVGACVECFELNRALHERCCLFQEMLEKYRKSKQKGAVTDGEDKG